MNLEMEVQTELEADLQIKNYDIHTISHAMWVITRQSSRCIEKVKLMWVITRQCGGRFPQFNSIIIIN